MDEQKLSTNLTSSKNPSDPMAHDLSSSKAPLKGNQNQRLWRYLAAPICVDLFTEIELLLLTFCTGIQDATTFPDYHCFASNQTGNTVLLAISILDVGKGELFDPRNIGTSLGLFLAGGWVIGQAGHLIGPRRRLWLLFSNLLSTAAIFAAAAIQYVYGVQFKGAYSLGVIALLSFGSGAQVVLSRSFSCNEISTAMATAAWVDLLVDPHWLAKANRPRNRRLSFLFSLFAGAFVGACLYVRMGSAFAIMISAAGKAIVTILFLFNPAQPVGVQHALTV